MDYQRYTPNRKFNILQQFAQADWHEEQEILAEHNLSREELAEWARDMVNMEVL